MKLLIDAGNSRIKWALADMQDWLRTGAVPVDAAGELSHQFAGLDISEVWASNVAGETIARQIRAASSHQTRFIAAQKEQCGVRNDYPEHSRLGSDRWAALIAAWHIVRGTCLVVNSGTATTVDALSDDGAFIGGLILPGIELMQRSLCNAASQLAHARSGQGEYVRFPLNTADALYSGALQASCGAIERQHALLESSRPEHRIPVMLSGGAAELLRNHLNLPLNIVDNLVLRGLWIISQGEL